MLRAIGIYGIDSSQPSVKFIKTTHCAPKSVGFLLFSYDPLDQVETKTLPQLSSTDMNEVGTFHFAYQGEHHYLKKVSGKPFLMVISSKKILEPTEIAYLMINTQHAFERPDSSGVNLEDIIMNPLGYTNTDHLILSSQAHLDETKQILLQDINKLLERGEKIDMLNASALQLTELSNTFKHKSQEQSGWCGNC